MGSHGSEGMDNPEGKPIKRKFGIENVLHPDTTATPYFNLNDANQRKLLFQKFYFWDNTLEDNDNNENIGSTLSLSEDYVDQQTNRFCDIPDSRVEEVFPNQKSASTQNESLYGIYNNDQSTASTSRKQEPRDSAVSVPSKDPRRTSEELFEMEPEDLGLNSDHEESNSDSVFFSKNALLCERLRQAAGTGNKIALRWLKKHSRHRRKDHCLFQLNTVKKKKRKKRTAAVVSKMTDKAEDLMRRANNAYLDCNLPEAISLLEEAIKEAPGLHDPFHVLGLLYEQDLNDLQKALDCYLIAAYLLPDDHNIWRRVATMSKELGHMNQAIHAYRRALRTNESTDNDVDEALIYDLSLCYIAQKKFRNASTHLEFLYIRNPGDAHIGIQLANCYCELLQLEKAAEALSSCLTSKFPTEMFYESQIKEAYFVDLKTPDVFYNRIAFTMLATLFVRLKQFNNCEALLLNVLNEQSDFSLFPLKLLVYLGVSQLHLGQTPTSFYARQSFELLLASTEPKQKLLPLYLLLIDAFYFVNDAKSVLTLFTQVSDVCEVRSNASVWVMVARCKLELSSVSDSKQKTQLNTSLLLPDVTNDTTQAKFLLSEIITRVGRSSDTRSLLYSLITTASVLDQGLPTSKDAAVPSLPRALPYWDRLLRLQQLQKDSCEIIKLCTSKINLTPEQTARRLEWIDVFLKLVQDSELDSQRVLRYNVKRRLDQLELDVETQDLFLHQLKLQSVERDSPVHMNLTALGEPLNSEEPLVSSENLDQVCTGEASMNGRTYETLNDLLLPTVTSNSIPTHSTNMKLKEFLGLISLENILGWKDYSSFLEIAIGIIMRSCGMYRQAVELLEAILENKRLLRVQHESARHDFFQKIQQLSLEMAIEGGLYRLALSRIRKKFSCEPETSNQCLQAIGKLLFSGISIHTVRGGMPSPLEKEALLEARAWCIRQLLQRPNHFLLTLLAGHFCNASGRWRLSVEEYLRAHRLAPHNDLTCLALATSLLNLTISRIVKDRHGTLLRGFAMMSTYAKERRHTALRLQRSLDQLAPVNTPFSIKLLKRIVSIVFSAEIFYNMARAYHQISLFHLSVPLYTKCIVSLNQKDIHECIKYLDAEETTGLNREVSYVFDLLRWDVPQLRLCSMHNLALIYRSRKAMDLVTALIEPCIIWRDEPSSPQKMCL